MTETNLEFFDDPETRAVPDSPVLASVAKAVETYDLAMAEIKALEGRIALRKDICKDITTRQLPDLMAQAGTTSFVTSTGRSVKIDQQVNGNIPALSTIEKAKGIERAALEARRSTALEIVKSKWPGLIKTEVVVTLGIGETELASRIVGSLRKEFQLTPTVDENVNANTLNAHFRELKENGKLEEIPVEPFNLYVGPIAKIK